MILGQSLLTGSLSFDANLDQLILTLDGSAIENAPQAASLLPQAGGGFLLQWQGVAGVNYVIDYKQDLTDLNWEVIQSGIIDGDSALEWPLPVHEDRASGFYRVRIQD